LVKVATWNVNSIKARLGHVLAWLEEARPDILCLQEIKCLDADFPALEIKAAGYRVESLGQRAYNGVAILSRAQAEDVARGLPGNDGDQQARYLEASIAGLRVAALYLPNGNPTGTDKYAYKLAWMARLEARARALLETERPCVLAGDFNVAPTDDDVFDPAAWREDALCRPETRAQFRRLLHAGYVDAFRVFHAEPHRYSFWDYQQGRWLRDEGLRIDHLLLSPQAADGLVAADIDREPRGRDKASDHTPVWCEIAV
jgi:exodeoxyribonuclease III